MRHARLTVLTFAVILATAACSGASSPAPSTLASVAAPSVAPPSAPSAGTGSAVSIVNFSFQPATITISVGTTVTWTNTASTGHTVTADAGSFKSNTLGPGVTFSQKFATAGTFTYHCSIHPSMKGTVTVH
jgi:plastocyanin